MHRVSEIPCAVCASMSQPVKINCIQPKKGVWSIAQRMDMKKMPLTKVNDAYTDEPMGIFATMNASDSRCLYRRQWLGVCV